jgi:hypothetical protein
MLCCVLSKGMRGIAIEFTILLLARSVARDQMSCMPHFPTSQLSHLSLMRRVAREHKSLRADGEHIPFSVVCRARSEPAGYRCDKEHVRIQCRDCLREYVAPAVCGFCGLHAAHLSCSWRRGSGAKESSSTQHYNPTVVKFSAHPNFN